MRRSDSDAWLLQVLVDRCRELLAADDVFLLTERGGRLVLRACAPSADRRVGGSVGAGAWLLGDAYSGGGGGAVAVPGPELGELGDELDVAVGSGLVVALVLAGRRRGVLAAVRRPGADAFDVSAREVLATTWTSTGMSGLLKARTAIGVTP